MHYTHQFLPRTQYVHPSHRTQLKPTFVGKERREEREGDVERGTEGGWRERGREGARAGAGAREKKEIEKRWRKCMECLPFVGHFLQKSPIISDSFRKRDLQFKASYASWKTERKTERLAHIYAHIHTHTHTYTHTNTRTYIHTHTHTYIHTHIHAHTHTHVHTQ